MTLTPHLLVLLVTGTLAFLITMILRRVCARFMLLDFPDARKIHKEPVPYLGGVAVYLATMLGIGIALHLDRPFRYVFLQPFVGLFVGAAIIFLLGIFDDLGGSTAGVKFSFQCVAATVMWWYDFKIDNFTNPATEGGVFEIGLVPSWILTVFWFTALTNAMNLIDGLDGLAAGIGAIAATTLAVAGLLRGENVLPFLGIALAGSLIGFLPHNLHPARIFLGDTGAMTIGFLLAAMSLGSSAKSMTITTLLIPSAALAVPVADTLLALLRRSQRREHLFRADRDHIHHRLLRLYAHSRTVLILHLATLYFAVLSLGYVVIPKKYGLAITILLVGSAFLAVFAVHLAEARSLKAQKTHPRR